VVLQTRATFCVALKITVSISPRYIVIYFMHVNPVLFCRLVLT
jgi:hypothetical protein